MQATEAFTSAGAAAPDEFYDAYSMDVEAESHWARARRRFFQHRLAMASLIILLVVSCAGLFAAQLAPQTYQEVNLSALNSGPTWAHPFGTDQIGRDYFSRVLFGLHTEVQIALLIGLFGTVIGTLFGATAGYFGGAFDNVIMRGVDVLLIMPPLIVVLVAAANLHTDTLLEVSLLFACLLWMPIARVVRGATLSLREREYVDAARAVGASDARIIRRHILPNAIGPIVVAASIMTASAVVLEVTLSYLGFTLPVRYYAGRTDTTLPSLGDILAASSSEGFFNWWGTVFPGLAVVLLVAPIYFVGEGIRDALDPTPRRYVRPRRRKKSVVSRRISKTIDALPRPRLPRVPLPSIRVPRLHSRRLRLLLEALVVMAITAGVAVGIYAWKVNPVGSVWAAAGIEVQNVSRAPGAQTEIAVASGGSSGVLLAASNDSLLRTIRVYGSTDAGQTWTSAAGPSLGAQACARGEPAAAIDGRGRQYVAFIVNGFCTDDDPSPYLVAAARSSPTAGWTVRRVAARPFADSWDDQPTMTAAGSTAYLVWSRLMRWKHETIVVSSTTDGGRTWSRPRPVHPRLSFPRLVSATSVGRRLYVTGIDAKLGVWLAGSTNGGRTFHLVRAAPLPNNPATSCAIASGHPTPFSSTRCVGPNPSVAATEERVYVTYGAGSYGFGEPESVHVAIFDSRLRRISYIKPAASPEDGDRFWPASAVDPTTGRVWVCFYDTTGDSSRKRAWYACTVSWNGSSWSTPLRAASEPAIADVLWEDARIYRFGDEIGYGGNTAVAAISGSAQPMWIDTRDVQGQKQEIFSARLDDPGYYH